MSKEINQLKKDKLKALSKKNYKEVAEICNYIGRLYSSIAEYDDALHQHNEELSICKQLHDTHGQALAHRAIGECYSEMSRHEEALKQQLIYLNLAQQLSIDIEIQRAYATIGRTHLLHAQELNDNYLILMKAEDAFKKALELSKDLKEEIKEKEFQQMVSRLYLNLGLVYDMKDDIEECRVNFQRAIHLCRKYDLKDDLIRCQSSLASFHQRRGELLESSRFYDDAILTSKLMKNKVSICDALLGKGIVMMMLKDFEGGRGYFKKAFKLKTPVAEDNEKAMRCLKIASVVCDDHNKLLNAKTIEEKLKLYDKMGDHFVALKCYFLAIEYYKEELRLAIQCQKEGHDLASIYVSIAQTYLDNRQFSEALECFYMELDCHKGNNHEECKTLLKIADIKEEMECDSNEIIDFYEKALGKCGDNALRTDVLKHFSAYFQMKNIENSRSVEIRKLYDEINDDIEEIDDDGDDATFEEDDEYDNYNIEDLSESSAAESDSETETNNDGSKGRPKRQRKKTQIKLNEVGETPLHRACIMGQLKAVERIIQKGHSINCRDFCGWLPLHEAVNHGHFDIVNLLIEKGAHINDPGGDKCDGITPIHDACSCGHIAIAKLLMKKGANVSVLTKNGDSPLDCLLKWKNRVVLNDDEKRECLLLERELSEAIHKNPIVRPKGVSNVRKRHRTPENSPESSPINDLTQSPDHFNLTDNNDRDLDYRVTGVATREYKSVMTNLRRQNDSNKDYFEDNIRPKPKVSALLNQSQVVDDWLIDDCGINKPKKRSVQDLYELHGATKRTNERSNKRSSHRNYNNFISDEIEMIDDNEYDGESVENHISENVNENVNLNSRQSNDSDFQCVRVLIENKTLIIPVLSKTTNCLWLKEEVSKRYFEKSGVKPKVSLETYDGALLSDEDNIAIVVNDKIIAKVESWILEPIHERFKNLCVSNKLEPINDLEAKLQFAYVNGRLILSDLNLPHEYFRPLLMSLQRQDKIIEIDLSFSNILFNVSKDLFSSLISNLILLQKLNLKCTSATIAIIESLCDSNCDNLIELNLSYNTLNDFCGDALVKMINHLRGLHVLDLKANEFSAVTFMRNDFLEAIKHSKLKSVILDYNSIDFELIQRFKNLPFE